MAAFPLEQLVQHILSYQTSRDTAYKRLRASFLASCISNSDGNLTGFNQALYIGAITEATPNFAVLSKFIRICLHFLEQQTPLPGPIIVAVKLLQATEKTKLETTAAYHLAHIRKVGTGWDEGYGTGDVNEKTVRELLETEVKDLKSRLDRAEETIVECKDEIREGLLC